MMEPEQVRALLLEAFPEADVVVQDMTGTQISEPVLALPKAAQEALAANVAPATVPIENPPSDP